MIKYISIEKKRSHTSVWSTCSIANEDMGLASPIYPWKNEFRNCFLRTRKPLHKKFNFVQVFLNSDV